ncbi:MAG: aminotransferase class V-fold PLP-dependent enzyme [Chitinivibrionales bacterium]|nr:aminotransferase class V-fold PLP-dependent enzyme [Chitinivibrionales bacterium]
MKVPFFGLDREYAAFKEQYLDIVHRVYSHGKVLQGDEVEILESSVATLTGRNYAVAVNSCTDALFFALRSLGVRAGDEVLVTNFSFIASASSILRCGAKPVFVDIDGYCLMDLEHAQSLVTQRTKAIIFVHLFGQMGDCAKITRFAQENGLVLVEDAAQAFGAEFNGKPAGSLGDISCFSFDPTKVIGAPGSGGMVVTDNESHYNNMRAYRYHGRDAQRVYRTIGYNSQMPSLTAALLKFKLEKDREWQNRRINIAQAYFDRISDPVHFPDVCPHARHIYHKFALLVDNRDAVKGQLQKHGVACMIHYPSLLSENPVFADFHTNESYKNCHLISKKILSLPIHPFLTDAEVEFVINTVCKSIE